MSSRYTYSSGNNNTTGVSILGVVQIVFIILKLLHVIDQSWWLVLVPLWIDLAIFVLVIIGVIIYEIIDNNKYNKKRK